MNAELCYCVIVLLSVCFLCFHVNSLSRSELFFFQKTKRFIQERLQAVSGTMELAVDQLVEAMDACTDGEFRKLSGPLLRPATSAPVLPSVNEQISLKPIR